MSHDPTEHAQEHIHHEAAHGHGPKWITAAALTAAFLAAFAAVSSSLATKHLTESTLKRIAANDQWNYYQSKSIKRTVLDRGDMIWAIADDAKKPLIAKQHDDDQKKKAEYATKPEEEENAEEPKGMTGIQNLAKSLETVSAEHLETHETYETSATMFHIAIAVVAIAVVAKRKEFWFISMAGGVVGIYFFAAAYAHSPATAHKQEHAVSAEHGTAAPHAATAEHAAKEPGKAAEGSAEPVHH